MSFRTIKHILASLLVGSTLSGVASAQNHVGESPWGAKDELGRLNLITPASRADIMSRVSAERVYDLSVDYFVGMPSWQAAGDPHYQIWMTHTPHGTEIDDPMGVGREMNGHVGYTGSAISMYTHTGTHIDAFNHFGIGGQIYNGFRAEEHLGDRGWMKTGAETIPPWRAACWWMSPPQKASTCCRMVTVSRGPTSRLRLTGRVRIFAAGMSC